MSNLHCSLTNAALCPLDLTDPTTPAASTLARESRASGRHTRSAVPTRRVTAYAVRCNDNEIIIVSFHVCADRLNGTLIVRDGSEYDSLGDSFRKGAI